MGIVYHYTSPEAALSILSNKKLRFTDCEYLNDQQELSYCYQLYDQAWIEAQREFGISEACIERTITQAANPYECESAVGASVGECVSARYYVLCSSTCRDSAVMWSNYAGKTGNAGYALGFDSDALVGALNDIACQAAAEGLYIEVLEGPVCYDREEQVNVLKELAREYFRVRQKLHTDTADPIDDVMRKEIAHSAHWARMSALAPFMKSPAFSGEQEYRFVLKVAEIGELDTYESDEVSRSSEGSATLRFHAGHAGVMTAHIEVFLTNAMKEILRSICVAASANQLVAEHGMKRLLTHEGLKNVPVLCSEAHLRW